MFGNALTLKVACLRSNRTGNLLTLRSVRVVVLLAEGAHGVVGVLHARVAGRTGDAGAGGRQGGRARDVVAADLGLYPLVQQLRGLGGVVARRVQLVVVGLGARGTRQAAGGTFGWRTLKKKIQLLNFTQLWSESRVQNVQ